MICKCLFKPLEAVVLLSLRNIISIWLLWFRQFLFVLSCPRLGVGHLSFLK